MGDFSNIDESRLWIGNLDPLMTEFALLKLLQNFNVTIKNFDMVYHRSGPDKGKSRGYCFLTVGSVAESEILMKRLDGRRVSGRRIQIRPANSDCDLSVSRSTLLDKKKVGKNVGRKSSSLLSGKNLAEKTSKIREIERKLKAMAETEDLSAFTNNTFSKKINKLS